jgi:glutathione S-transferase
MITVYHLSSSRSERIIWLMEELQEPYEIVRFMREGDGSAPPAMRDVHPLGKSPIIRDDDLVLAESGAIVEYLCGKYQKLTPQKGTRDYTSYLYWLHFAEGSAMAQFILEMATSGQLGGEPMSNAARFAHRTRLYLKYIETALEGHPYIAGRDFSGADTVMMSCAGWVDRQPDRELYPNILAYRSRIGDRPAYKKGMAIANPPASVQGTR